MANWINGQKSTGTDLFQRRVLKVCAADASNSSSMSRLPLPPAFTANVGATLEPGMSPSPPNAIMSSTCFRWSCRGTVPRSVHLRELVVRCVSFCGYGNVLRTAVPRESATRGTASSTICTPSQNALRGTTLTKATTPS